MIGLGRRVDYQSNISCFYASTDRNRDEEEDLERLFITLSEFYQTMKSIICKDDYKRVVKLVKKHGIQLTDLHGNMTICISHLMQLP